MYSIGPTQQTQRVVKAYWKSPEQDAYDAIYWDLWECGYRGSDLRRRVAVMYRSVYGN